MKKFEISRFWYIVAIGFIIILSYIHFSAIFFPFIDIHTAINVLMTPGYSIPGDLYLWGQNFYGSLVPFLAQILNLTYRFPPAMAVSVVHFLILTAGFLALSTFFRSRYTKILLGVLWFIPAWHAIHHVTGIWGLQSSLFAIAFYLMHRYSETGKERIRLLWLSGICAILFLSIWVSDFSYISLIVLIGLLAWKFRRDLFLVNPLNALKSKDLRENVLVVSAWVVFSVLFLWYAKSHAAKTFSLYHPLFDFSDFSSGVKVLSLSIIDILLFSSGNPIESIYSWGMIVFIIWIWKTSNLNKQLADYNQKSGWFKFYFLQGVLMLVVVLMSSWVAANGFDRRYFSILTISFGVCLLFFIEISNHSRSSLRKNALAILFVLGALSSLYSSYIPKKLPATIDTFNALKPMEYIGIIAASEPAYFSAFSDPSRIKSTPHDKEYIRNFNLALDVLKQDRIYLVKDGWLQNFPDTIVQFAILLQRRGEPFKRAGYEMCRYEKIVKRSVFTINEMKFQGKVVEDTNSYSLKTTMITPDFDRGKHFLYGPFITLPKGKYSVVFRLMTSRDLSVDNVAVLDVSANFGKEVITSKTIRLCDFAKSNHFEEFEVPFETAKDYEGMEFRIMFLGGVDLSFDRVVLIQKQN